MWGLRVLSPSFFFFNNKKKSITKPLECIGIVSKKMSKCLLKTMNAESYNVVNSDGENYKLHILFTSEAVHWCNNMLAVQEYCWKMQS